MTHLVGGENPTNDALFSVEVGHWGSNGDAVQNPYYNCPEDYTADRLVLETSHVDWQVALIAAVTEMMDRTRSGAWSEDLATVLACW